MHNIVAIDIAKNVFQLHFVDRETGAIQRKVLKRHQTIDGARDDQSGLVDEFHA